MISRFYQRYSKAIITALFLSLAVLYPLAESIPPNNNTETWLSDENEARQVYEDFRFQFGGEELILVALDRAEHDPKLIEAICGRLERLDVIRKVWSPERLSSMMAEFDLSESEIEQRLHRVAISQDGKFAGIVALLTDEGLHDRTGTMNQVDDVLQYCQLDTANLKITGAPVIVAELNRLGGKQANQVYFGITIAICLGVLFFTLKQFTPAFLILVETIWAFQLTLACVRIGGGEMNFILDSLPVMVMVFSMAVAIHYLHHFATHRNDDDPIGQTLKGVRWPCLLATCTTAIGLASLGISTIPPVRQFGIATAGGTFAALIAGLGITPAILTLYPPDQFESRWLHQFFRRMAARLYLNRVITTMGVCGLVMWCGLGMIWIKAEFQPLNFFPDDSKVLQDTKYLHREMASTDSVELVIDFGTQEIPDTQRIEMIRQMEETLREVEHVQLVLSATTFLPDPLPQGFSPALDAIRRQSEDNDFIADGGHLWRISARVEPSEDASSQHLFHVLSAKSKELAAEHNVEIVCTGIAPLVERAQQDIFDGFWKSVFTAFCLISVIMVICLKSPLAGAVAMIPNVTPIMLVFGTLGWLNIPTDIGTMMTGSIALGIAVDGTFHFLTCYRRLYDETGNSVYATRVALETTGPPIVQATVITGLGMLALGLSNFGPTVRFGLLMTTSLFVALIGDLILLPCLLYMRPSKVVAAKPGSSESDGHPRHIPEPHLGKPRRSTEPTGLDDDAEGCFV
ncbi:MAG: putative RND superfamily exporter protein [Porticoccaceae bacterium]|jgi:predicted RND superfamily exporter protein